MFTRKRAAPRNRGTGLSLSILLHLIALLWLLTTHPTATIPPFDKPLVTIDLAPLVPETPHVVKRADPESDEAEQGAQGGGGGRMAKAVRIEPDIVPAPADVPIPIVKLDLPPTILVPTAPISGSVPARKGGTGSGMGIGDGTGIGEGRGSGDGSGSGLGDGSGTGRGSAPVKLQAADWIVRPTDLQMQEANPWQARRNKISGSVTLSCRVKNERARKCKVIRETPTGQGFGRAATEVAYKGRIRAPIIGNEDPETVRVRISILFENL